MEVNRGYIWSQYVTAGVQKTAVHATEQVVDKLHPAVAVTAALESKPVPDTRTDTHKSITHDLFGF